MTEREQRFVEQYMICLNGAKAAKHAGFSPKWADREANRLLKRNDIKQEIEARTSVLTQKAEVGQEQLLTEFVRLGLSNMSDFVSWDAEGNVTVKPSDELTKGQKAAIKKIESDRVTTIDQEGRSETRSKLKIELYPKEGPLTKLGEKYGLFPKDPGKAGDTYNQFNLNLQKSSDPIDLSILTAEEKAQFRELLCKIQPKVIGEGKA